LTDDLAAEPRSATGLDLRGGTAEGPAEFRCAAPLEAQFVRSPLRNSRTIVRFASTLTVLLIATRGAERLIAGVPLPLPLPLPVNGMVGGVIGSSLALLCLAWSGR
jgi:hypothetical protein